MTTKAAIILALDTLGDLTLRQPLFTSLLDAGYAVTVVGRRAYAGILPFLDPRLSSILAECNPYAPPDGAVLREVERLKAIIAQLNPSLLICASYNHTYIDELICWKSEWETIGFLHPEAGGPVLDRFLSKSDARYPSGEFRFKREVRVQQEDHECEKANALLKKILGQALPDYRPTIQLSPEIERSSAELLEELKLERGKYAFGCPAGTVHVPIKAWPLPDYVEAVSHLFKEYQLMTLISGLPQEDPYLSEIVALGSRRKVPIRKWLGSPESLGALLGLIRYSRLYLGNDSGPMHLAGALGVPVVAQFGGGTWPRFLPMARRAFVSTQKVPCFGCGWDCWLDETVCMTRVAPRKVREGIDWILSSNKPGRRIELGEDPGTLAGEMIWRGIEKRRSEVENLRRQLVISEADRAARLEVIQDYGSKLEVSEADRGRKAAEIEQMAAELRELSARLEASEADRSARLTVMEESQLRLQESEADRGRKAVEIEQKAWEIKELAAHLEASEADRAARLDVIQGLQRTITEMSTARWAAKRLLAGILRRLGVYETVVRLRRRRSPTTNEGPAAHAPEPPAPTAPIDSPLVEAFIAARAMPGDTGELALECLFEMGAQQPRILCAAPTPRNVQALQMLAKAGARITAVRGLDRSSDVQTFGMAVENESLSHWMIAHEQTALRDLEILLLDAGVSEDVLRLLRGRLWLGTRVLVQGAPEDEDRIRQIWGAPEREAGGMRMYSNPPASFLDPAQKNSEFYVCKDWPRKPRALELPPMLPSGRPWPKITVVTVTFNQAVYLEETLRSVLNQGYPNLEYILLDGKSTDGTSAILERYRNWLAFCVSEKDEGQSDALNKGFARSTGEIQAWLNSDDRYLPGTLIRVALAFDTYDADVVAGGCALVQDKNPQPFSVHHNSLPLGQVVPLPLERLLDVEGSWIKGDFFWQPEVFWRRSIWERAGGRVAEDLFYSMDYDLWVRMAQKGARIVHIPDTLAIYRMHKNAKTTGTELPYLSELREVSGAYQKGLR